MKALVMPPGSRPTRCLRAVACVLYGAALAVPLQGQSVLTVLPRTPAFEALSADPLAPRFSGALVTTDLFTRPLNGHRPDAVRDASALDREPHALVSLGGIVPMLAARLGGGCRMTASVEALVLARFRLRTTQAMSNDWWVGVPIAASCGAAAMQLRLYHRSDHLNDEFLLLNDMNRHGPVQDGVDATASWRPADAVRIYGGGGHIMRGYWGPFGSSTHGGIEYLRSVGGDVRLVAALHLRAMEMNGWRTQRMLLAGVEYRGGDSMVRVALRDLRGPSTVGEFFMNDEHQFGIEMTIVPGGGRRP
jgi:hypothetical protein